MEDQNYFIIARVFHVIGVVLWIGGVAFVTTVLIPSIRELEDADKRLALFEALEGRFSYQAKIVTVITALSGVYMLERLNIWSLYLEASFWWLHLMTLIWLIFTLVLFVLEPLFLHRWFHQQALADSERAFRSLHTMHKILLSLSLIAIFGAVAGVRGFQYF